MRTELGRRAAAVAAVVALSVGLSPTIGGTLAQAAPAGSGAGVAPTSRTVSTKAEAARVDAVATPRLSWYGCYDTAQCTTVKVPLDYDQPNGAKVELALLRRKARDPKHKIGSLFVNPGGPGASAAAFAYFSDQYFSKKVLDRFDIVGMDPRGTGFSDNVTCLSPPAQQDVLKAYDVWFPLGAKQEKSWIAADKTEGSACSRNTLATSMSTAEVARDMELMRRAVGDDKLTYLGLSYGTYLGQVYANLFPDRFRAVAVDGVLDPVAWAGSPSSSQPLEARIDSAGGAWKALREILLLCDKAGGAKCDFSPGDPVANLRTIADRLRAKPLVIEDEESGESFTFTYQDLVVTMLADLYDPAGYEDIVDMLADLYVLTEPPASRGRTSSAQRAEAARALARLHRDAAARDGRPRWGPRDTSGHGFPYDNSIDALASVTCTDSTDTVKSAQFPALAEKADERAPYFGRAWLWNSSVCAADAFTGQDEDVYAGPFDTRTKAPVLFVGNYYDPATNYDGAVSAAKRMPNSRLLSSRSFGHTAYGTSSCTTKAVDAYLLAVTLPRRGKVCVGEVQPFQSSKEDLRRNAARQRALHQHLDGPFPRRR